MITSPLEKRTFSLNDFSEQNNDRLEINIVNSTNEYQEVEIIYGNKKKRKKITKFLPSNFANIIYPTDLQSKPSATIGVTTSSNLSNGLRNNHIFLQEKFLRILSKIYHISEIKTAEKIWDSNERINTTEKSILVAVVNHLSPEGQKMDRSIVSLKSGEISNQNSFQKFIEKVCDLAKNSEKILTLLFGDDTKNLSEEKRASLAGCLRSIVSETDDSKRDHQMKFLHRMVDMIGNNKFSGRSSF
jgi:hypothetical protein